MWFFFWWSNKNWQLKKFWRWSNKIFFYGGPVIIIFFLITINKFAVKKKIGRDPQLFFIGVEVKQKMFFFAVKFCFFLGQKKCCHKCKTLLGADSPGQTGRQVTVHPSFILWQTCVFRRVTKGRVTKTKIPIYILQS